jgi:hypothetical protein
MNRGVLAGALVVLAWPAFCQDVGNLTAQERSDVVFRDLALPVNTHSAIYLDYFETNTSQSANPQDLTKHPVIQMTGVISAPAGIVTSVAGIQFISMETFKVNAGIFGDYLGAYDNINQATVIPRGTDSDSSLSRMAIQRTANQLLSARLNEPILYVVAVGDNILIPDSGVTPKIKQRYMTLFENANPSGSIGIGDIETMRSDAFVEYSYASNGFPVLNIDISNPAGLALLQQEAIDGNLTPENQRAALVGAIIEPPTVTVLDNTGNAITDGAATNVQSVQVRIQDYISGPGRVEISKDGTFVGANSGITSGAYFDGVDHTFTTTDLASLGNLTDGHYTIRGFDQAGNTASVNFTTSSADFSTRAA